MQTIKVLYRYFIVLSLLTVTCAAAHGQGAGADPLSSYNRKVFAGMKDILVKAAEKMPEEHYNFKPTDAVRSYGQIVGHITEANYMFCSLVRGDKSPAGKIEGVKTSKADLIAALKGAYAFCDKAYADMTDASGAQTVKLFGSDTPKLGALNVNLIHTSLHYGNLVTYLRMKNIVPPSSDAMEGRN